MHYGEQDMPDAANGSTFPNDPSPQFLLPDGAKRRAGKKEGGGDETDGGSSDEETKGTHLYSNMICIPMNKHMQAPTMNFTPVDSSRPTHTSQHKEKPQHPCTRETSTKEKERRTKPSPDPPSKLPTNLPHIYLHPSKPTTNPTKFPVIIINTFPTPPTAQRCLYHHLPSQRTVNFRARISGMTNRDINHPQVRSVSERSCQMATNVKTRSVEGMGFEDPPRGM